MKTPKYFKFPKLYQYTSKNFTPAAAYLIFAALLGFFFFCWEKSNDANDILSQKAIEFSELKRNRSVNDQTEITVVDSTNAMSERVGIIQDELLAVTDTIRSNEKLTISQIKNLYESVLTIRNELGEYYSKYNNLGKLISFQDNICYQAAKCTQASIDHANLLIEILKFSILNSSSKSKKLDLYISLDDSQSKLLNSTANLRDFASSQLILSNQNFESFMQEYENKHEEIKRLHRKEVLYRIGKYISLVFLIITIIMFWHFLLNKTKAV